MPNDDPNNPYDALWDDKPSGGSGPQHSQGPHPDGSNAGGVNTATGKKKNKVEAGTKGDVVKGTPTGTVSAGGSSGGSFGGSSAGYAPPSRFDRLASEAEGLYYQLWGEFPPPGYTQVLVKKGMNIFEIEDHERRKPAFTRTETYQNEYMAYAKMLSNLMGAR